MPIARIVVSPIPTTDWWAVHIIQPDPDRVCGGSVSRWTRGLALAYARKVADLLDCPVVTYPKEEK